MLGGAGDVVEARGRADIEGDQVVADRRMATAKYLASAADLSISLPEAIPTLCTLVTASPFDAAIHDAYGKLHGRNAFEI